MNPHQLVLGDSGTGKTEWKKNYAMPRVLNRVDGILIMDVKGYDYRDIATAVVDHPKHYKKALDNGHKVVRWKPSFNESKSDDAGAELDKHIKGVDRCLLDYDKVICDIPEAHSFMRSNHIYGKLAERAFREWRDKGAAMWLDTQYPTDLKGVLYGAGHLISFQVPALHDKAKRRLDYTEEEIANLELYHWVHSVKKAGVPDTEHPPIDL